MTTRLALTLLGGFEARLASGRPLGLRTRKAQALLACLALARGRPQPRARLAALLWGDAGDEQARSSLRQTLFALRRALPGALVVDKDAVTLDLEAADVDVAAFEACVSEGTPEALERAAALYRGDLLDGLDLREAAFEDWLRGERERLRALASRGLEGLLAHQAAAAAPEPAIQTAIRLLALDPVQEPAHRALMRLYVRQGRRGAALRQYQLCVAALQRELGVEPEAETRELYQEILQRRRASPAPPAEALAPRRTDAARRRAAWSPPEPAEVELPLIGRDAEWGRLRAALDAAWRGHGAPVAILGEAGIGKSRLAAELAAEAGRRGGRVLVGRCYELEQILPFRPWVDALGSGLDGPEGPVLDGLGPVWRAELARLLPEWGEPGRSPAGPADDYLRLFEAMAQLVAALASQRPLVVVLEDLHWADEMSLRLLAFLGRRASRWPVLLVGTAREEDLPDALLLRRLLESLSHEPSTLTLRLAPLARADSGRLVDALLAEGGAARIGQQIEAASEGNPFMMVETVRAIREGTWPAAPTALPLPDRVREVIAGRLERLGERARELVAVAATIGRQFDFGLLVQAAGLPHAEAAQAVEELVRRRVLQGLDEQFDFTHDRIREVAYGRPLPAYRRLLHRRVAEALEALHADDLDAHASALGVHYREGEVWPKALTYLRRAGHRAAARGAHREAVACFESALAVLEHLPAQRDAVEQAVDLRFDLRCSLNPLGEFGRIIECLREAEALADRLGDERRVSRAASYLSQYFWVAGEPERSIEHGRRALDLATAAEDLPAQVVTTYFLGRTFHALGDYRGAIDLLERNGARLDGPLASERFGLAALPSVACRIWLAWSLAETGRFDEGLARAEEAVRIAEGADAPFSLAGARLAAGVVHLRRGDIEGAVPLLERARDLCRAGDFPFWLDWVESFLGHAYALSGRPDEAMPLLRGAAEPAGSADARKVYRALWVAHLGEARLLAGDAAEALEIARGALALAREGRERGHEAWALRLVAEAESRVSPGGDGAEPSYRDAIALAAELGMRPLEAHCRLGLGRLYSASGRVEEARTELAAARDLFRSMGMARAA